MIVVAIKHTDTSSWNSVPRIVALAVSVDSAKQWIQDEVDGKHQSGISYAQGLDVEWWLKNGGFSIHKMEVHQ